MDEQNWNVIPNQSINGIYFGTKRTDIRNKLGKPKRTFLKTSSSENTTDAYSGFHIYYSKEDEFEAIEFLTNSIHVYINQKLIYPGTINSAKTILPNLVNESGIYISKSSSIGLTAEEGEITSIFVGCDNYYNLT